MARRYGAIQNTCPRKSSRWISRYSAASASRRHIWRWGDRAIESDEHFFFLRVEGTPAVQFTSAAGLELNVFRAYRWWSVAELDAVTIEVLVPERLSQLVRPLLRGEFPTEPIDAGA